MTKQVGSASRTRISEDLYEWVACDLCGARHWSQVRILGGYPIVRCRHCGLCFANPRFKPEILLAGYSNETEMAQEIHSTQDLMAYYQSEEPVFRRNFTRILETLERFIAPGKVLDVGCGPGIFMKVARERGWQVQGVEIGTWAQQAATEWNLPIHIGTLESAKLNEGEFDVVTLHATLEHLPNPSEVLYQASMLVRPGGMLVVTSLPNFGSLSIRLGLDDFALNRPMGHLYYFTCATAIAMLRRVGLEHVAYATSYGINLEGLKRLVRRTGSGDSSASSELPEKGTSPANKSQLERFCAWLTHRFFLGTMMDFYVQK